MNKLYIIKWCLLNGYEISITHYWTYAEMKKAMKNNTDWCFVTVENNDCHMIVKAY